MASFKVRYFVTKAGANGDRHFWQPPAALRAQGWESEKLANERNRAIERAELLNARLDAWRAGRGPAGNHAVPHEFQGVAAPGGASLAGKPRPSKATFGWLVDEWKKSAKWTAKPGSTVKPYAQKTQDWYTWLADELLVWTQNGTLPIAAITPARVQKLYTTVLETSHSKANGLVTVLRIVLGFCRRNFDGIISENAAEKPGLISMAPRVRIWTTAEVDALVAHADALGQPSIGDAVLIAYYTAQRQSDVLKSMPWLRYQDASGSFILRQRKTGARIEVPAAPALKLRLVAAKARQEAAGVAATQIVVCETTGQPWNSDHFRAQFARVRNAAAGLFRPDKPGDKVDEALEKTRHLAKAPTLDGRAADAAADAEVLPPAWFADLRDTCVTVLAEAGATLPQTAAITGHSLKTIHTILQHYLALTGAMAAEGVRLMVEHLEKQEAERNARGTKKLDIQL